MGRRNIGDIKSEDLKVLYGYEPKLCSKALMSDLSKSGPTSSAFVVVGCSNPRSGSNNKEPSMVVEKVDTGPWRAISGFNCDD
mgnify:FL=1